MDIYRKRNRGVSWPVTIILLLLASLIAGTAGFFWQASVANSRLNANKELSEELKNVKNENESLQKQKTQLEKDVQALKEQVPQNTSKGERETIQNISDQLLHALKNKDMSKVAEFVHPDKGVRFTPYSFVDAKKDVKLAASEIPGLMTENTKRIWGTSDGKGDPIDMPFSEYYKKFVYDVDFLEAPDIVFNLPIQRGTSLVNIKEAYPDAKFIEYHFPGFDPQYNGLDWRSLQLVFEQKDGKWYLTGIIHSQWTT